MSEEQKAAVGITDGLLRLSVGIETAADLLDDIEGALRMARPAGPAGRPSLPGR